MKPLELLDLSDPSVAAEVWRLQHAAYAVEARLIGFAGIPPLRDTIESLQACKEKFFGIRASGGESEIVAAIACETEGAHVTICRMMVHPEHHRQGYATRLLMEVEQHYAQCDIMTVSTGSANEPAVRLYLSRGFAPHKEYEPVPGLKMTEFIKRAGDAGNE
jgi:GNAT superfamily N-acetyltransferase